MGVGEFGIQRHGLLVKRHRIGNLTASEAPNRSLCALIIVVSLKIARWQAGEAHALSIG